MTRPHGASRYTDGPDEQGRHGKGCRCQTCRKAKTRQQKLRRLALERGTHQPMVDAEPVREHVAQLRAAGLTYAWIARAAGVTDKVVDALLYGQVSTGGPTGKLRPENAAALLAVSVDLVQEKVRAAVGVQRRLRGLALLGWPAGVIADRAGLSRDHVVRLQNADPPMGVTAATAAGVVKACSLLWAADPVSAGTPAHRAGVVRRLAASKKWTPLLAWDDIDSPDAVADLGESTSRDVALFEDSECIVAQGHTLEQAAERIGVEVGYLRKARARGRQQLAEAAP